MVGYDLALAPLSPSLTSLTCYDGVRVVYADRANQTVWPVQGIVKGAKISLVSEELG